jgi:hypothetical protein
MNTHSQNSPHSCRDSNFTPVEYKSRMFSFNNNNNNNNNYYYYYYLQLGCHPVAVINLHVYNL